MVEEKRLAFPKAFLISVILSCCILDSCISQTFHYSHGWTNGKKRSQMPPISNLNQNEQEKPLLDSYLMDQLVELDQDLVDREVSNYEVSGETTNEEPLNNSVDAALINTRNQVREVALTIVC